VKQQQTSDIRLAMLLRLNISDAKTGICVFEKIWYWNNHTSVTEGICNLVLTFHKISKEIGDSGDVSGVVFEPPPSREDMQLDLSGQASSHKRTKSNMIPFIRLACEKDEFLSVAVFHDMNDSYEERTIQTFVKNMLSEFSKAHKSQLTNMRSTFDAMVGKPTSEVSAETDRILAQFKDFENIVETLRIKMEI